MSSRTPRTLKRLASLRASFWFVPLVFVVMGVGLGVLLPIIDAAGVAAFLGDATPWLDSTAEGARALLTASATALATILAVAFSMTMVTVQLASSQYTSRLLRRYMSDRTVQSILGLFLATVSYLLLVLRSVRSVLEADAQNRPFVPTLSVLIATSLTLACLGALVAYLHHTTRSVQAATIIARLGADTIEALAAVAERARPGRKDDVAHGPGSHPIVVHAKETGYVQFIDVERLAEALGAGTGFARVEVATGSFVFPGVPLVSAARAPACDEQDLHEAFAVGRERTIHQDVLYGVRQLVDVALKALSPAVNDPTTAVMVVNELGAIASAMVRHAVPEDAWVVRQVKGIDVAIREVGLRPFLFEAYDEILRAAGDDHPRVKLRIAETLALAHVDSVLVRSMFPDLPAVPDHVVR